MVFERASTGRLAAALVWGLGLWVGAGVGRKILVGLNRLLQVALR
jgi:hypothetical protein